RVYSDAEEPVLRDWYIRRFMALRDTAFHDPRSYFHRYAPLSDEEATATAVAIWERTNLANLEDNILPTRPRAKLILKKGADHVVETVALRRLERRSDAAVYFSASGFSSSRNPINSWKNCMRFF